MPKPLLFISHKHSDSAIAAVVANWVRSETKNREVDVEVFLSSDAQFKGPRFGAELNQELRKTLRETDVLILIYTSADEDWSYCMWECGAANRTGTPETTIIVFQCGNAVPKVFQGTRTVKVRNADDLKAFSKQFFSDDRFFSSLNAPLTKGLTQEDTDRMARKLEESFAQVQLPESTPSREWIAWPFLQIDLKQLEKQAFRAGVPPSTDQIAAVKANATIVSCDPLSPALFGLAQIESGVKFAALASAWQASNANSSLTWFDVCCEQMALGAAEMLTRVDTIPLRHPVENRCYVPVLGRIRKLIRKDTFQFELFFHQLPGREAEPVSEYMMPMRKFFWKRIDRAKDLPLIELKRELRLAEKSRLPLLDEKKRPLYVIHRSMIDQFIADQLERGTEDLGSLTVSDLLSEDPLRSMFESAFAVVTPQATVREARNAMTSIPNCRDIFVTRTGSKDEPILGWLTNVDLEGVCSAP
jgi:hypothetical protein